MPIEYHKDPERFRGTGTVFSAWDEERGVYTGYWDLAPDGAPTPLEHMPETSLLEQVVAWGRERTPVVLVRPQADQHEYHWAGTGTRPVRLKDLPALP